MTQDLKQQVEALQNRVTALESLQNVPFIESAKTFIANPAIEAFMGQEVASADLTDYLQDVSEGGGGSYAVGKEFDTAFILRLPNGRRVVVGAFNIV